MFSAEPELMEFPTRGVAVPTVAGLELTPGRYMRDRIAQNSACFSAFREAVLIIRRWYTCCSIHRIPMAPESLIATDEVLNRVQGEFLEMPGLRLTEPQARRLWGLDAASCGALLDALVDAKFLFRTRDGAFMRVEYAAPVKATVRSRKKPAAA
jgi:hypothetical protein